LLLVASQKLVIFRRKEPSSKAHTIVLF